MKACGIVKIWTEINVQLFGFDKLSAVVSLMCKFSDLNQLLDLRQLQEQSFTCCDEDFLTKILELLYLGKMTQWSHLRRFVIDLTLKFHTESLSISN